MSGVKVFPNKPLARLNENLEVLYSGQPGRIFATVGTVKQARYTVPTGRTAILRSVVVRNTNIFTESQLYFSVYDATSGVSVPLVYNKPIRGSSVLTIDCWIPMNAGDIVLCGYIYTDTVETAGDLDVIVSGQVT